MNVIQIFDRIPLHGRVKIQGSKNASLPIMAAALLTYERSSLRNCPRITDVYDMAELLRTIGCEVKWMECGLEIQPPQTKMCCLLNENGKVRGMRSSICLLGALLGRCGAVYMEYPGGCVIGERPIDLHRQALEKMGVQFRDWDRGFLAYADCLHGADINLPIPSVGATENVIMAAVAAEGRTVINGAAKEPEIVSLCTYLKQCGAQIEGEGSDRISIEGGRKLYGTEYNIPADRIVAGTYLFTCIGAGGDIFLENAPADDMAAVLETAALMGAELEQTAEGIYVLAPVKPKSIELIKTGYYPEFPTDLQSVALAVECMGDGETEVSETVFEDRFKIVPELKKMGAEIEIVSPDRVRIQGVDHLHGADVTARELRGGAALVTAGCMATGKTSVCGTQYIARGYENICRDLQELGARILSE